MSHPITYFSDEEKTIIMELARLALADAETFDMVAEDMDISDEYLQYLRDKIEMGTEGIDIYDE